MKKVLHIVYLSLFLIGCFQINAQTINYKKEASKKNSNFFEIVQKTRKQFTKKRLQSRGVESILDKKANKIFERWVWIWKDRVNPDGSFPKNQVNKEEYLNLLENNSNTLARSSSTTKPWVQIGPTAIVEKNGNFDYPGPGRVDVVAVDPANSNIMYVGTPAGGLWKTTDKGATWAPKTDDLAGMGVTDILIVPTSTTPTTATTTANNTLYMATGDRDSKHISSIGLYKSINSGDTWAATGLTFDLEDNEYIRDIAFVPGTPSTIFALTNSAIKRSTDGGVTWTDRPVTTDGTTAISYDAKFQSMVFDPNDPTKVVVSDYYDGIYYSTDSGNTFKVHPVLKGGEDQKILRITASPADNDYFYGINQDGIFRKYYFDFDDTADDIKTSTSVSAEINGTPTPFDSQSGYIQCIAVSPTNSANLMVGGVQGWKSTDNGASFSPVLNAYTGSADMPDDQIHVHADHHFLLFTDGATIINGNDAGLRMGSFSPADATDFPDISSGLIITQSYNIAITHGLNGDDYMMANQDNDGFSKVFQTDANKWVAAVAGDGTGTAIDYNNTNIRYLGGTNGSLDRTTDGYAGGYASKVEVLPSKKATDPEEDKDGAAFISPLVMHPTSSITLYAGHEDVKKTTDKGDNWTALNSGLVKTNFIEVVLNGSSTHIYAIGQDGNYGSIAKTTNNESTWVSITPPAGTIINSFAAMPNSNTVYASVSGYINGKKIFKSTDKGASWTNISTGLPNIIMKRLIVDTSRSDETLYVGTELGVYWKNNTMADWAKLGTGLPNVIVTDLKLSKNNGNLYIGTFGRGMWVYNDQKYFDNEYDNNWFDTDNWEGNTLPTATDDVLIKGSENVTVNDDGAITKSLEILDGALLTIEKSRDLTVESDFSSTSTNKVIKINSDAADSGVLIVKGTATGKVEFERGGLIGGKWSLVSVPVEGQKVVAFGDLTANDIKLDNPTTPTKYAIADYNDANATGNKWVYYAYSTDENTVFTKNKGYIVSRNTSGSVTFTGTLLTDTQSVPVVANQWNAIGNPFTAYYPANKNASNSFINENSAKLESAAVYIWDGVKYSAITDLEPSTETGIPPGQGFFVKTKAGVTTLTFNKDKRESKQAVGDVFNKTEKKTPYFKLFAKNSGIEVSTTIIYSKTATLGLDTNEDILNFDSSDFDITTQLLADNVGKNYTMQSIPNNDFEKQIIPINLKVEANKEVVFRATTTNIPDDVNIYLEDKVTNQYYKLNNGGEYKVTPTEEMKTIGRFHIHISRNTLDVDVVLNENVKIFNADNNLHINGLNEGSLKVQLFNTAGKQVFVDLLKSNGNNKISLDKLATGVYLVKVNFDNGSISKKIIIK